MTKASPFQSESIIVARFQTLLYVSIDCCKLRFNWQVISSSFVFSGINQKEIYLMKVVLHYQSAVWAKDKYAFWSFYRPSWQISSHDSARINKKQIRNGFSNARFANLNTQEQKLIKTSRVMVFIPSKVCVDKGFAGYRVLQEMLRSLCKTILRSYSPSSHGHDQVLRVTTYWWNLLTRSCTIPEVISNSKNQRFVAS